MRVIFLFLLVLLAPIAVSAQDYGQPAIPPSVLIQPFGGGWTVAPAGREPAIVLPQGNGNFVVIPPLQPNPPQPLYLDPVPPLPP